MELYSKLLIYFILGNLIFYLLGAFISFNLNPLGWWLFYCGLGRFFVVIIELFIIASAVQIVSDDY